jgi:Flp pilus assembly pilin Flp
MIKKNKSKNSQRGAALVEMALLSSLIAVVAIQSIGQLGNRTADRMCDNSAKVRNAEKDDVTATTYFYDKEEQRCCTASAQASNGPPGRGRGVSGAGSNCS